jgi:hypothetical protein
MESYFKGVRERRVQVNVLIQDIRSNKWVERTAYEELHTLHPSQEKRIIVWGGGTHARGRYTRKNSESVYSEQLAGKISFET